MRLVFWQNCLSPHQLPYIAKLMDDGRVTEVVVATDEKVSAERAEMGWQVENYPGLELCEVCLCPTDDKIEALLAKEEANSVHLFSGVRGFAWVFDVYKRSLKYNLKRGIIHERPNTFAFGRANGKPIWLHRLRWKIQDHKYMSHLDYVFAMGDEAVDFFRSLRKNWSVFPFGYCTQLLEHPKLNSNDNTLHLCFVGSLSCRKSADTILFAAKKAVANGANLHISFIGDGPERTKMEQYVHSQNMQNVSFRGYQKQTEIPAILSKHDMLVLPSIYDGWGAVVNEALQSGLYTVCSDCCGAKALLADSRCGAVFKSKDTDTLASIFIDSHQRLNEIRHQHQWRKDWALRSISGEAMAKYMIDCLTGKNAALPWIQE